MRIHMSRLWPGTEFRVGDETYTLVGWNECSSTVTETKPPRLVRLTARYGQAREFLAKKSKTIRIASDIVVEVDTDTDIKTIWDMIGEVGR